MLCAKARSDLLQRNLTPHSILSGHRYRGGGGLRYTRIFGRDAAICVMAMCGSGVPALEQGAVASLDALAAQQAANGQIPKYVDPEGRDADFWGLGCIDATLWWLIAVDHVAAPRPGRRLRTGRRRWIARFGWLLAQEHQHFRLLQQNEASDWADIMPRSGYVLYTNALVVRGQAPLCARPCRGHAASLQPPVQPVPARPARVPSGAPAAALGASRPARSRPLSQLRESRGRRRRGRRVRQRACDPERAGRRLDGAPHRRTPSPPRAPAIPIRCAWCCIRCRASTSSGGPTWRAISRTWSTSTTTAASGPSWAASGSWRWPARAWRRKPGPIWPAGEGERARRLALHRVVPRPDAGAHGHARPELERGHLPARPARLDGRRGGLVSQPGDDGAGPTRPR